MLWEKDLDALTIFFFVGLFEEASVLSKYVTWSWIVHTRRLEK